MKTNVQTVQVVRLPTESRGKKAISILNNKYFNTYLDPANYSDYKQGTKHYHLYFTSNQPIKEDSWIIASSSDNTKHYIGKVKAITETHNSKKAVTVRFNNDVSDATIWENQCKKIEATTDSLLTLDKLQGINPNKTYQLPQIPQSFIEAYVKAEGRITEVNVEIERISDPKPIDYSYAGNHENNLQYKTKIKTRSDNTVIIHEVSKISKEEMYLNMQYYHEYCEINDYITPQLWLEKYKHF